MAHLSAGAGHTPRFNLGFRQRGLECFGALDALHVGSLRGAHRPLAMIRHCHAKLPRLLLARMALELILQLHQLHRAGCAGVREHVHV